MTVALGNRVAGLHASYNIHIYDEGTSLCTMLDVCDARSHGWCRCASWVAQRCCLGHGNFHHAGTYDMHTSIIAVFYSAQCRGQ